MQRCSCIVNPRACYETELNYLPATVKKKIAVVGAGPAGLAAASIAAERGHEVFLFESTDRLGGQFNMAKVIPGKEDYAETIRYYKSMLDKYQVNIFLNTSVNAEMLNEVGYDEIILATGVTPRVLDFKGADHPKVLSYRDVLWNKKEVGNRVAIVGAGGIGFDVSEFLSHDHSQEMNTAAYMKEWGVNMDYNTRGAYTLPQPAPSPRKIFLLKRSTGKHGKNLGKTTGWIHRASLKMKQVEMLSSCEYLSFDGENFEIKTGDLAKTIQVDNIVVCAGQVVNETLSKGLKLSADNIHVIGGAKDSSGLDAKRAIKEAAYLVAGL